MKFKFTVKVWGDTAFEAATYDEVYAKILDYQAARARACQFRFDWQVTHVFPGDEIPYDGGYWVIDNHAVEL